MISDSAMPGSRTEQSVKVTTAVSNVLVSKGRRSASASWTAMGTAARPAACAAMSSKGRDGSMPDTSDTRVGS